MFGSERLQGGVDDLSRRRHAGVAELQMIDMVTLPFQRQGPIHDHEHFLPDQAFASR